MMILALLIALPTGIFSTDHASGKTFQLMLGLSILGGLATAWLLPQKMKWVIPISTGAATKDKKSDERSQ